MSLVIRNIETWKTIPNFNKYEVSDFGNVKSKPRMRKTKGGCFRFDKGKVLKPLLDKEGYHRVNIYDKNGRLRRFGVHNLVLMAFNEDFIFKGDLVTHHKNHIRNDNKLENLELVTYRKNAQEKKHKGTSELSGVNWDERLKQWKAQIVLNKKHYYLGLFDSQIEANQYYNNALTSHAKGEKIKVKRKSFSSKYKGVAFCKQTNKWIAYYTLNGKTKNIGRFKTEYEAYNNLKEYLLCH